MGVGVGVGICMGDLGISNDNVLFDMSVNCDVDEELAAGGDRLERKDEK